MMPMMEVQNSHRGYDVLELEDQNFQESCGLWQNGLSVIIMKLNFRNDIKLLILFKQNRALPCNK